MRGWVGGWVWLSMPPFDSLFSTAFFQEYRHKNLTRKTVLVCAEAGQEKNLRIDDRLCLGEGLRPGGVPNDQAERNLVNEVGQVVDEVEHGGIDGTTEIAEEVPPTGDVWGRRQRG